MVRQRIIVRPLPGRMGQQQTAVRSWALNVINELPDDAHCHWATFEPRVSILADMKVSEARC